MKSVMENRLPGAILNITLIFIFLSNPLLYINHELSSSIISIFHRQPRLSNFVALSDKEIPEIEKNQDTNINQADNR